MSLLPNLDELDDEQKMAVLESVQKSIAQSKEIQKRKIGENVDLVVQALKKIEEDIRSRYDDIGNAIEKRVASIKDGRDGIDGRDGKDGKDGKQGKEGRPGRDGKDGKNGLNGVDGQDGVSVVNAHIDFDGSLIISLSSGKEINVGEVVAPALAEQIKVITNGGGTSQSVLDTLTSLQSQIDAIGDAVVYKGLWNASTNSPTITSGVGTSGNFYIVSVAGSTNLDGITNWKEGDWAVFNGVAWQRVEGGADGNFTTVTASSLTSGRVTYAGAGGLLQDSSNLTFNGTTLTSAGFSGPLNGTVGATTPSTGAFTTLSSTGNTTLGDATTDTVTVNGYMGVGGGGVVGNGLQVVSSALSGVNQTGVYSALVGTSGGTNRVRAFLSFPASAAASYTVNDMSGFWAADVSKGAGSTITNLHGLYIADQTQGTNNYGITSLVSSGANKWNIYASGTAQNYFAGNVGIGTSSPNALLELAANNTGITTGAALNTLRFYDTDTSSAADQPFGAIEWYGADTSNTSIRAFMRVSAESATVPSYMSFGTATAAGSATERLRITSTGNVGIGVTPTTKLDVSGTSRYTFNVSNAYTLQTSLNAAGSAFADDYKNALSHIWQTSGTERMRIDSSGNVGIGTSSPAKQLDLAANNTGITTGDPLNTLRFTDTDTTSAAGQPMGRIEWFSADTDTTGVKAYIQAQATDGSPDADMVFATNHVSGGGTAERMRIQYDGNVGIGTSSPGQKLHVNTSSGSSYIQLSTGSNANLIGYLGANSGASTVELVSNSTYPLVFATNGAERARITSSGVFYLGSLATNFSFTNGSAVDLSGSGTGLSGNGTNLTLGVWNGPIVFQAGNSGGALVERARIDSSGNVGIGTTSAYNSAKLSVNGDLEARGNIKSYYSSAGGISNGATQNIMTLPAGSYGSPLSGMLNIQQRNDNTGNLTMSTYLVSAWGGAGAIFTAVSTINYGSGSSFSITASTSGGDLTIYITNTSGATSTSINFSFMRLAGTAPTYAF